MNQTVKYAKVRAKQDPDRIYYGINISRRGTFPININHLKNTHGAITR